MVAVKTCQKTKCWTKHGSGQGTLFLDVTLDFCSWGNAAFPMLRIQGPVLIQAYDFKGSPEGSSDQEFRGLILCDVVEIS